MYKPLVMFFGLTNSLATFKTMMNALFKDLIYAEKSGNLYRQYPSILKNYEQSHQDGIKGITDPIRQQSVSMTLKMSFL